jgi:hypothetical protein
MACWRVVITVLGGASIPVARAPGAAQGGGEVLDCLAIEGHLAGIERGRGRLSWVRRRPVSPTNRATPSKRLVWEGTPPRAISS